MLMPGFRHRAIWGLIGAVALSAGCQAVRAEDWLPISPDELRMTNEARAPGAPAIFLYRQVDRDDNGPSEAVYARIKILADEGRRYADVEVPFDKATESVYDIQARIPTGSSRWNRWRPLRFRHFKFSRRLSQTCMPPTGLSSGITPWRPQITPRLPEIFYW
jgi:hypothetical protein